MEDQTITITGTAHNGKDGALIVAKVDEVYYIDGLEFWDESIQGKTVSVTGQLKTESLIANEIRNENGEWKTGVVGDKKIILEAQWKVSEK